MVHCSSVFANNVPKKQSNIRIRRNSQKKLMILLRQLTRVVMSCVKNVYYYHFVGH